MRFAGKGIRQPAVALAWALATASVLMAGGANAAVPTSSLKSLIGKATDDGRVRVIIKLKGPVGGAGRTGVGRAGDSAAAVDGFLKRQFGGQAGARRVGALASAKPMSLLPMLSIDLTATDLRRVSSDPLVEAVYADEPVEPTLDDSVALIGAAPLHGMGNVGGDAIVAVLDTGTDLDHPFLQGRVVGEACFSSTTSYPSQSLCPMGASEAQGPGSSEACDVRSQGSACNHGTHVAGIAVGSFPKGRPAKGVAPGASLLSVQVYSYFPAHRQVLAWTSDVIRGMEYVYAKKDDFPGKRIAAVNLSLGAGRYKKECLESPFLPIVSLLRSSGIATVAAAGNEAFAGFVNFPACTPGMVVVSATDKSDNVASFSNLSDQTTLFAPGNAIRSSVVGGGYKEMSGTSMATPHVAGALAVLSAAFPDKSIDDIVGAMVDTGVPISRFGITKPRLDMGAAFATLGGAETSHLQVSPQGPITIERAGTSLSDPVVTFLLSSDTNVTSWRLEQAPSWLLPSDRSGTVTQEGTTVSFRVKAPNNQRADLTDQIVFRGPRGERFPIPVTLRVVQQELIVVPDTDVSISNVEGRVVVPATFGAAIASNVGNVKWRLRSVPSWLRVTPSSGSAAPTSKPLTISVSPLTSAKDITTTLEFVSLDTGEVLGNLDVTMKSVAATLTAAPLTDTIVRQSATTVTPSVVSFAVKSTGGSQTWKLTDVPSWLSIATTEGSVDETGTRLDFQVVGEPGLTGVKNVDMRLYMSNGAFLTLPVRLKPMPKGF